MIGEASPVERFHIICERDVGLFSLIQQVIANVPWAVRENRIPVVYFGENTCYWTPGGYQGRSTVWEYYFQPLIPDYPASAIPDPIRKLISADRPTANDVGSFVDDAYFVSRHFGDHPRLRGVTLPIPYQWDDPGDALRRTAKAIVDDFVRPRSYLRRKADEFFHRHLAGRYVIGVHARGTDATSTQERRSFRQDSLVLSRYLEEIERLLSREPAATIFVASDDQASVDHLAGVFGTRVISYDSIRHRGGEPAGRGPTGWIMPAYIAGDRDTAARNGEDAVIEYLLLSRCDHLVHNGSSLARTVLLNAPALPHTNTHRRPAGVQESP
jgi:hypothetical protein